MVFDKYTFDFFNQQKVKDLTKANFELLKDQDTLKEANTGLARQVRILTESEVSLKLQVNELKGSLLEIKGDIKKALARCESIVSEQGDDCDSGFCGFQPVTEYFPPAE